MFHSFCKTLFQVPFLDSNFLCYCESLAENTSEIAMKTVSFHGYMVSSSNPVRQGMKSKQICPHVCFKLHYLQNISIALSHCHLNTVAQCLAHDNDSWHYWVLRNAKHRACYGLTTHISVFTSILWGRFYYYFHCTDEEIKTQRVTWDPTPASFTLPSPFLELGIFMLFWDGTSGKAPSDSPVGLKFWPVAASPLDLLWMSQFVQEATTKYHRLGCL